MKALEFIEKTRGKAETRDQYYVELAPINYSFSYRVAKRLFDFVAAAVGMLIILPFLLVIGILVRLSSPGPAVYVERRVGRGGHSFLIYKFRTMVANAEDLRRNLLEKNEMEGPAFKIRNDPRITPLGRFLRKYSIDELLQLWCVIKGDMSLVGPRPPRLDEVIYYESWQWRRLGVLPGITCKWQVEGRNDINDFNRWVRLDMEYIENWSFRLDLELLLRTVQVVLRGTGI